MNESLELDFFFKLQNIIKSFNIFNIYDINMIDDLLSMSAFNLAYQSYAVYHT